MNKSTIAIFGATSAIAKEYARLKCDASVNIILVGRNKETLSEAKNDLLTRGAGSVEIVEYDFENIKNLPQLVSQVFYQPIDIVLLAYGTLPDQEKCKADLSYMQAQYTLNSTSILSLLSLVAEKMKAQKKGTIAVITSVAGDRGKKSNYFYGAAKASVSTYLQGLRQDLFTSDVNVVDIKPGFVDTPMTSEFPKGPLWAKPAKIAKGIDSAVTHRRNTVYLPFFWRWIMLIITSIPERIFKKMKL